MYAIMLFGFGSALTTDSVTEAVELCKCLIHDGYSPKVNGILVTLNYGPGYDTVIWDSGDFAGQSLLDTVVSA